MSIPSMTAVAVRAGRLVLVSFARQGIKLNRTRYLGCSFPVRG